MEFSKLFATTNTLTVDHNVAYKKQNEVIQNSKIAQINNKIEADLLTIWFNQKIHSQLLQRKNMQFNNMPAKTCSHSINISYMRHSKSKSSAINLFSNQIKTPHIQSQTTTAMKNKNLEKHSNKTMCKSYLSFTK